MRIDWKESTERKNQNIVKESRELNKEVSIQNRQSTNIWRYTIRNAAKMSSHPNFMRVI